MTIAKTKFTLTALKKQLSQKSQQELIKEIAELYKTFPQVKEYYQAQNADVTEIAKKYKAIIIKEFAGTSRNFPKARYSVARKAVSDFKKLTQEPALIADMMLVFVESASDFCNEWGPDGEIYYTSPENMFEDALNFIRQHKLLGDFQDRAYSIVRNATEGWGHCDSLRDRYDMIYE